MQGLCWVLQGSSLEGLVVQRQLHQLHLAQACIPAQARQLMRRIDENTLHYILLGTVEKRTWRKGKLLER
jgi:hypothetical protein